MKRLCEGALPRRSRASSSIIVVLFSHCVTLNKTLCLCGCQFSHWKKKKGGWMTWSLKFHPGRNIYSHGVWHLRGHSFSNMGVFVLLNRNSSSVSVALVEFRLFILQIIYYIKASRKHNWIAFDLLTEYSYGFTWVLHVPVSLIRKVNCKLLYVSDIHHGSLSCQEKWK